LLLYFFFKNHYFSFHFFIIIINKIGWEEHVDSATKVYYLNHATECATRKHPLAAQLRQQGEGAKIAQIFTTLGQRSQITAKYVSTI